MIYAGRVYLYAGTISAFTSCWRSGREEVLGNHYYHGELLGEQVFFCYMGGLSNGRDSGYYSTSVDSFHIREGRDLE